jgi:hypothetical protein
MYLTTAYIGLMAHTNLLRVLHHIKNLLFSSLFRVAQFPRQIYFTVHFQNCWSDRYIIGILSQMPMFIVRVTKLVYFM